jgi:hypothetical protein
MPDLVYCRACRKRVSDDAVKELKGELFCPKCYGPMVAKLKEQKERKKQTEAAASAPSVSAKAFLSPPSPAPQGPPPVGSQRLAARATGVVGARQSAGVRGVTAQPAEPAPPAVPAGLPDLPEEFMLPQQRASRGGAFGFGPESLGKGVYLALVGGAIFVGYLFVRNADGSANWPAVILLCLAAVLGSFAVLAGVFNVFKGGELRKQIAGGVAVLAGLALAGLGGTRCVNALKNEVKIGGGMDVKQAESKPEQKPEGKPEPKPEVKPEPKPVPKPVGPGHPIDLVAVKPKPEDQPSPKPEVKPELRPEDKLKAEVRALLPGAATVEASALGLGGPPRKLEDLPSQPLTAVVLLSRQLPGLKPEIELTVGGANKTGAELAEVMRVGEYVSVLRDEFISDVAVLLLDGGERLTGEVKVKAGLYQAAFPFEARRNKDGKWQIESFTLRSSARKVVLEGGKWRVTEAASTEPAVRFVRALSGVALAEMPAAVSGIVPETKHLALYGELDLAGKAAAPLTNDAPGLVLGVPGSTRTADALTKAKIDTGWRPLALLVSGGPGPFLAMPNITPTTTDDKAKVIILTIVKKGDKPVSYEVSIPNGTSFPADAGGLGELVSRLTQLTSRVANRPVRIVPDADAPLSVTVAVVDACCRARAQLQVMSIDPAPLLAAPGNAPGNVPGEAPAPEKK